MSHHQLTRKEPSNGYARIADEVSFEGASGAKIRIDGVFRGPDGKLIFGEAKVGETPDLTKNQKAGLPELQDGKGKFYGGNAKDLASALNIKPDEKGRFTIPAEKIRGVYIGLYDRSNKGTERMRRINEVIRGRGFMPRAEQ